MAINDWSKATTDKTLVLGRYIVADPKICHVNLIFRGTRIFVADVLNQVAKGMDFESIRQAWRGDVSHEAVAEAVRLAREALLLYWPDMEIKDAAPDACVLDENIPEPQRKRWPVQEGP